MKFWMMIVMLLASIQASLLFANDGKAVYDKYCNQCHGDQGDGNGYAYDFVMPKPRDFTTGVFKFRSTGNEFLPTDDDLARAIRIGIPGTSMPAFDHIGERAIDDVVTYIKTFFAARIKQDEEDGVYPPKTIAIGKEPPISAEMIAAGRGLYIDNGCADCHGKSGKADGPSGPTLRDDYGIRTKPANLATKWLFRGGATLTDIYRAFSTGLSGTPMPSYQDSLSDEQRWQLAAYVHSLSPKVTPQAWSQVVASKVDQLPDSLDDAVWEVAEEAWFPLTAQVILEPINTDPTILAVRVKALHDGESIALRVSWDDPTFSLEGAAAPAVATDEDEDFWGDEEAPEADAESGDDFWGDEEESDGSTSDETPITIGNDQLAVQFPSGEPKSNERPYFLMGSNKDSVNLWRWTNEQGLAKLAAPESDDPDWGRYHVAYSGSAKLESILAKGSQSLTSLTSEQPLSGQVAYENGSYTLLIKRRLIAADVSEIQMVEGKFIPMAFWAWDGHHGESGLNASLSAWYFLVLGQPMPENAWIKITLAAILTLLLQWLAVIYARRRKKEGAYVSPSLAEEGG